NFNTVYRNDAGVNVAAFTATQIPNIENRVYPAVLAGPLYPDGIPILPESDLEAIMTRHAPCDVVFAYSDVSHEYVMHMASRVLALGGNFVLLGPSATAIPARIPVVAVGAVRTGAGKSQTSRKVVEVLRERGLKVVVVRHPMPYGELARQGVQRFATMDDLVKADCTIEEREEYEPHLERGSIVFAGVDYGAILAEVEKEAQVLLWDGGNNDFPFYRPDILITVADPHRPGHEVRYHPGETNFRMADVIVINKETTADYAGIRAVEESIAALNPKAQVIHAASPIFVDNPGLIRGKRALVVEDGPTLTHGEMTYGAGVIAARQFGASELVDPRPWVTGEMAGTFRSYPKIGTLLPAMGYSPAQIKDMERTINATDCDVVVIATPIDLGRLMTLDKPAVRVRYELEEIGQPKLGDILNDFCARKGL
ncbi:MAG TPA: cyclic 2,3-diphosphoglycerate synthase, partial [Candidatus Eisenbacteria bacterium]